MLYTMPVARSMERSISGALVAACASVNKNASQGLAKCLSKEKYESVPCRQQSVALGSQQAVAACALISYTSVNHGDLPGAVAAGRRAWRGGQQNQTEVCREQNPTRAASSARLRPEETPTPSIAVPLLHMMALTSAKSTFTRPGMVMMSLMPWTPCRERKVQ